MLSVAVPADFREPSRSREPPGLRSPETPARRSDGLRPPLGHHVAFTVAGVASSSQSLGRVSFDRSGTLVRLGEQKGAATALKS